MGPDHSDSAGPALRGFRLQMLYTLARLTEPQTALQATLWPEGIEDLAILDSEGELREAIQIKGYTAPLTLSELISKAGRGLLHRVATVAREHPACRIRLLSFGPIGPELLGAWNGAVKAREGVVKKLKRAGLNSSDITLLFSRLTLEQVDEEAVSNQINSFLITAPVLGGQSEHAAAILCHWQYSRRLPAKQLDVQDRMEGKIFEAVFALWNAYLAQPTAHWPEPEKRAIAIAQRPIDQIPHRLERSLRLLEAEGIRTSILKQLTEWEDAPALWIVLDSEDPFHALTAAALAKPVLCQAISDASLNDEQTRALERQWQHIVILVQLKGRSLDQHAWLFPIYRLTARDAFTDFEWLDEIPRPVSDEDWTLIGLQCWTDVRLADARMLMHVIGRFCVLMGHLSSLLTLARIEGADRDVLQGYLDRYQNEWSGIIQTLIDALGGLIARYVGLSPEEQAQRPYLAEAAFTIKDHFKDWLPPGLDQGKAVMSVDTCREWLGKATAHIKEIQLVSAAMLIDSMTQAID